VDEKQLRKKRDQELIEILNEVRVALAGASVLFGFLLVVPFSAGWDETTTGQQIAYGVAFVATLLSVVGLMTPTAYHRLRWRDRNKERMLRVSHAGAVGGIALLAVAMTAGTFFVMNELTDTVWVVLVTVIAALAFLAVWFAVPLSTPYDRWDEEGDADELEELAEEPSPGSGID
jgi:predicted membrane channel-forming protein YqfA (hemolysin III family)